MQIQVTSKTLGTHNIEFDECDLELVNSHKWFLVKDYNIIYAFSYLRISSNPRRYKHIKLHRFLLCENDPTIHIDHRDGNGLNNKRNNLRRATRAENSRNRGRDYNNRTGYKGVSFKKSHNKYSVYIAANNKDYWGGHFDNPIDAAKRYNELARELHGEFAYQNPV